MIQVAVVGARGIGVSHAAALRHLPGLQVAAVVGSSPATASAAARSLDVPRWSADWRETVSDDTIDAVHVCMPNDLHFPIVSGALAAGKHSVCEKPLSIDAAEARKLADLGADQPELIAVAGYEYRFAPLLEQLRQLGYQVVNVETQQRNPSSLLHWTRRLVALRQQNPAFGLGSFTDAGGNNPSVLSYLRAYRDDLVLCINNPSAYPQATELNLSAWAGTRSVELAGGSPSRGSDDGPPA